MSRTLIAFHAADMSAMARALRKQLALREDLPSHLELLNMLRGPPGTGISRTSGPLRR